MHYKYDQPQSEKILNHYLAEAYATHSITNVKFAVDALFIFTVNPATVISETLTLILPAWVLDIAFVYFAVTEGLLLNGVSNVIT